MSECAARNREGRKRCSHGSEKGEQFPPLLSNENLIVGRVRVITTTRALIHATLTLFRTCDETVGETMMRSRAARSGVARKPFFSAPNRRGFAD